MQKYILLTFDVEDWFQVENLKPRIPVTSWPTFELRVEKNTYTILDLLDSTKLPPDTDAQGPPATPKATFFVLGWLARRLPHLVREIRARGHEVASHGQNHTLCTELSSKELREDLTASKHLLEDILGVPILGYRAPSFSVTPELLRIAEDCGFRYDSSFNSFGGNNRYGHMDLSLYPRRGIAFRISDGFDEVPISNTNLGPFVLPTGGGGYFRLIPSSLFIVLVRRILRKQCACVFYLHPWEIDSAQPAVAGLSTLARFRHYVNLNETASRFSRFMESFPDARFVRCSEYLHRQSLLELNEKGIAGAL